MKNLLKIIFLSLIFCLALVTSWWAVPQGFAVSATSSPTTTEATFTSAPTLYDGLWFMGFNAHKDLFSGKDSIAIKQAIGSAINRVEIAKKIMGTGLVPDSIIPPTMTGYLPHVFALPYDPRKASAQLKNVGYHFSDVRLKHLTLLHTDGKKTILIAEQIKKDLSALGIQIDLVQTSFRDEETWQKGLASGKYHLFLMGYKASGIGSIFIGDRSTKIFHKTDCDYLPNADQQTWLSNYSQALNLGYSPCRFCRPIPDAAANPANLLLPLFQSKGEANFCFYQNETVDALLKQIAASNSQPQAEGQKKLEQINRILSQDLPIIPLFYIEKL